MIQNLWRTPKMQQETTKQPDSKQAKDLNKTFFKKHITEMANNHRKRCSTALIIR